MKLDFDLFWAHNDTWVLFTTTSKLTPWTK